MTVVKLLRYFCFATIALFFLSVLSKNFYNRKINIDTTAKTVQKKSAHPIVFFTDTHSETKSTSLANDTRSTIQKCLTQQPMKYMAPISDIDQIAKIFQTKEYQHNIILQNVHLNLPDKQVLRLHLIPWDQELKNSWRLKAFTVDKEDLPVPLDLPEKYKSIPALEAFEEMKTLGEIFYSETRHSSRFRDGSSLLTTELNGKISELQYFSQNSMLGCRQVESSAPHCNCIQN